MLVFFLELREALLHYNPPGPETTYSADLFFSREKFTSYFFRLLELKSVWYFCSIFYSYWKIVFSFVFSSLTVYVYLMNFFCALCGCVPTEPTVYRLNLSFLYCISHRFGNINFLTVPLAAIQGFTLFSIIAFCEHSPTIGNTITD